MGLSEQTNFQSLFERTVLVLVESFQGSAGVFYLFETLNGILTTLPVEVNAISKVELYAEFLYHGRSFHHLRLGWIYLQIS